MQSPSATVSDPVGCEVRAPWPDEMFRLRHFLPEIALCEDHPTFLVRVAGPDERLIAAAALTTRQNQETRTGLLYLRTEPGAEPADLVVSLARVALERAKTRGLSALYLGQTFDETSDAARALAGLGFTPRDTTEVYVAEIQPTWERLGRIHERLRERGTIPAGVRLSTMQPALVEPVRRFLLAHMPGGVMMLAVETSGCTAEHSLVLLMSGEVKGVLLCGRHGKFFTIGLRVIAPELRSGLGWANVLLMLGALGAARQAGSTDCHFEANPSLHADTRQMAHFAGGRLVGRRVILAADLPPEKLDDSRVSSSMLPA